MATLKQRLRRKNASGTYDTVHLETESGMILRPSGRTVEADLAAYLPEYQDSDDVPKSLLFGKYACRLKCLKMVVTTFIFEFSYFISKGGAKWLRNIDFA